MKPIQSLIAAAAFPFAVVILLVLTAGCGILHVPKTTISGKIYNQPFEITSPKDTSLSKLEINVTTNGVTIKIDSLTSAMNPTNILATGAASAQLAAVQGANAQGSINAAGNFVGTALAAYMANMGAPKISSSTTTTNQ